MLVLQRMTLIGRKLRSSPSAKSFSAVRSPSPLIVRSTALSGTCADVHVLACSNDAPSIGHGVVLAVSMIYDPSIHPSPPSLVLRQIRTRLLCVVKRNSNFPSNPEFCPRASNPQLISIGSYLSDGDNTDVKNHLDCHPSQNVLQYSYMEWI